MSEAEPEREAEVFRDWMDMITKIDMPPAEMLEECPPEVIHTVSQPIVPQEPHDPYRKRSLVRQLEPGQILVLLPGEDAWRLIGHLFDIHDACEIAVAWQVDDQVRRYAWVDENRCIVEVSGPAEE